MTNKREIDAPGSRESEPARRDAYRLPGGPYTGLAGAVLGVILLLVSPWPGIPAVDGESGNQVRGAHFHHIHLNVTDPDSTVAYYETYFGAYPIQYRDRSQALFTERSFILMDRVDQTPPSHVGTALYHIGWSGVEGRTEFQWRTREGIDVETPATQLGENHYMYFWGPDRELVEVYTGNRNHRFEHLHFVVSNAEAAARWFERHLGLSPRGSGSASVQTDNVNLLFTQQAGQDDERPVWYPDEQYPEDLDLARTDGSSIDHLAFSYPDLESAEERLRAAGVEIVRPLQVSEMHGHTSFFVRGPDGLLIELVQEDPIPEAIWRGAALGEGAD